MSNSNDANWNEHLLDSARQFFGFQLAKAAEYFMNYAEEELEQYQLKTRHFGIMLLLAEHEPLQQAVIGRALRIDRTTMVALIDDLERLALVERKRDPDDRRAYAIFLTQKGRTLLPESETVVKEAEKVMLAPLSDSEVVELLRLLDKLNGNADS